MAKISENIKDIRCRILRACESAKRDADGVTIVCVTKTVEPPQILQAMDAGLNILAENRPQELVRKIPLVEGAQWHLIGHLQTNKVKMVVGNAALIHSVDSMHLARSVNDACAARGICQDILLELNISGEESKYGLTTEQIPTIIKDIKNLPAVSFKGFMTMAPKNASPKELEKIFGTAHELFDTYRQDGAQVLSMGMSGDFEAAVKMGATHVRIGSAIFK